MYLILLITAAYSIFIITRYLKRAGYKIILALLRIRAGRQSVLEQPLEQVYFLINGKRVSGHFP